MAGWEPMVHQLIGERRGRLVAFAALLAGPDLAEDLFHDALVATFAKRRNFESVAQAEQYVRRAIATRHVSMVRKLTAERRRQHATATRESSWTLDETTSPDPTLDRALATLPPRVRACIVLRFLSDMSNRDTASALGISEGAVKRYVSDGLAALSQQLGTELTVAEQAPLVVASRKEAEDD